MEAESTQSTEAYLKLMAWVHANRKLLMIGLGVAVVIALVVAVMTWEKNQAELTADAQLMDVPLMSVRDGKMIPAPPSALLDIAKAHPDTSAGEYAALLAAETLFTEGKYQDAYQGFSKYLEDHPTSLLVPQAKVGLAATLEGEGKTNEAAQKYQELILTYPTDENIVSPAKLTLARLDEQLNRPEQALQYYEDLAHIQNPYDPWAAEARERGMDLLVRHPELRKTAPTPGAPGAGRPQPLNLVPPGQKSPAPPAGKP
jgi:predicted negative regulator of RcsB-dependent stress response